MGLKIEPPPAFERPRKPEVVEPTVMREPMPTFGVALLDESRESGWACLGDTRSPQEPFRFASPSDLRNDCFWIVSAERLEEFAQYSATHNLRPGDYFSTKLKYLAADYGMRVDARGRMDRIATQASRELSLTVHRAMVIAAQCYPWRTPSQILRSNRLWEDVRKVLIAPPNLSQYSAALKSAYQSYSKVTSRIHPEHDVMLMVRFNRLEHAKRVMATLVPDPMFVHRSRASDVTFSYPMEKALDPQRPCLVKATVEFQEIDPELAKLIAFGETAGPRSGLRAWISQPELRWLSQFARVHITEVLVSEAAHPLPQKAQLPELLTSDPLFALSVPAGLVAEVHWHAIAEQPWSPKAEDKRETTLWATWLRATDRALCFQLALKAFQAGFGVQGYGNGGVQISLPRHRLQECFEWAMQNEVAHPAFEPIFYEHGLLTEEGV
ncbi:MAG: hypothetical protein K0Q43_63 [Ramlibacter sp.]|jgi:hypothetical protein|nr:hypothetical protein [Ramlibacter sp.]